MCGRVQGPPASGVDRGLQALKPAKRKQLMKSGLVKIEPQCGRASGGRGTLCLESFGHSGPANAVGRTCHC
jgi:hypothetical protein